VDPLGWTTANQYAEPFLRRKDVIEHRFHAAVFGAVMAQRAKSDFAVA
jgi:hypothetical protein